MLKKKFILIFLIVFAYSTIAAQTSFEGIINYTGHSSLGNSGYSQVFFKKNKIRIVNRYSNNDSSDIIFDLEKNIKYIFRPGNNVLKTKVFDPAIETLFPIIKKDNYKSKKQILGKECTAYTLDSSNQQRGSSHAIYVLQAVTSWFADSLFFTVPDSALENAQLGGLCNGKNLSLFLQDEFIRSMTFDFEATSVINQQLPDSLFSIPANATIVPTYPSDDIHFDRSKMRDTVRVSPIKTD